MRAVAMWRGQRFSIRRFELYTFNEPHYWKEYHSERTLDASRHRYDDSVR